MLIQMKPTKAGNPIEAIQFLGDPSIHPLIKWLDTANKPIDSDRWHLAIPHEYGYVLHIGDYILFPNSDRPEVLTQIQFERYWQHVPTIPVLQGD